MLYQLIESRCPYVQRTLTTLTMLILFFLANAGWSETSNTPATSTFEGSYRGMPFSIKISGYEISDAAVSGADVFLLLGKPGAAQGEKVRRYTVRYGRTIIRWEENLSRLKPWKLRAADVDGDGVAELILGTRGRARFHPVEAKRLFVYTIGQKGLTPRWLGSRLSRPFVDFEFCDVGPPPGAELFAVEMNADGTQRLAEYQWNGFGFTMTREIVGSFELKNISVSGKKVILNSAPVKIAGRQP